MSSPNTDCIATGTTYYDYELKSFSGQPPGQEICNMDSGTANVTHIVVVTPKRQKYTKIRVTGHILAHPQNCSAKFDGPLVSADGMSWQELRSVDIVELTFYGALIKYIKAGKVNIKTEIEESSRWTKQFTRIDQDDLDFTVVLR